MSHKEVERLQKELDELNKLKLVDQNGELLLECRVGDKYHQLLLEVGLNTILEKFIKIKEENALGEYFDYTSLLDLYGLENVEK